MGWRHFSLKDEARPPMPIRVLGAPGTGKTQLAAALAAALSDSNHAALAFTVNDNPPPPDVHSSACVTLLMGLDFAVPAAFAAVQQAADSELRDVLAQSGVSYQVVYGQGQQRLRSALAALQGTISASGEQDSQARWVWACDNCSDPQCERRLLSDLLAARAAP
jgi:hypothetical protein